MSTSARRYNILPSFNGITAHYRISIYTSAPFKFIIDGNHLYIHAELVSRHSKPLDRMINGYMSEAQKGFAIIKDVDEGTFVRFIQWAYKGYYEAGEFQIDLPRADSGSLEGQEVEERYLEELVPAAEVPYPEDLAVEVPYPEEVAAGESVEAAPDEVFYTDSGASSPPRRGRRALKESFIRRKPTVPRETLSSCPPRPNQAPNEDYTEVFLSHARVYVFAEKYDIQSLKALALDELHGTLENFDLYAERTGDIIALIRYVYANTGEPVDGVEDMRTVLKHYLGFEMHTLMKDKEFGELMIEDGGALLGDFMRMVQQRI